MIAYVKSLLPPQASLSALRSAVHAAFAQADGVFTGSTRTFA
ncbi:hypothetical protein [Xanthomonas cerealis]|nr:hypothetical protein [Xanthomonas translucens]